MPGLSLPESHLGLGDSAKNSKRKKSGTARNFSWCIRGFFWAGSTYLHYPFPVIARSCFRSYGTGIAMAPEYRAGLAGSLDCLWREEEPSGA